MHPQTLATTGPHRAASALGLPAPPTTPSRSPGRSPHADRPAVRPQTFAAARTTPGLPAPHDTVPAPGPRRARPARRAGHRASAELCRHVGGSRRPRPGAPDCPATPLPQGARPARRLAAGRPRPCRSSGCVTRAGPRDADAPGGSPPLVRPTGEGRVCGGPAGVSGGVVPSASGAGGDGARGSDGDRVTLSCGYATNVRGASVPEVPPDSTTRAAAASRTAASSATAPPTVNGSRT